MTHTEPAGTAARHQLPRQPPFQTAPVPYRRWHPSLHELRRLPLHLSFFPSLAPFPFPGFFPFPWLLPLPLPLTLASASGHSPSEVELWLVGSEA